MTAVTPMPLNKDLREFVALLNSNEVEYLVDGTPTHVIGRAALLHNKECTGRAKDLGDAEELRKRDTEQAGSG